MLQCNIEFEKFGFKNIELYLPVTYHTYKIAETTVEIPMITNNSLPENTLVLMLTSNLEELST